MDHHILLKLEAETAPEFIGHETQGASHLPPLPSATPTQPQGPFYPVMSDVLLDADLVLVQNSEQTAQGEIVFVEGTVRNPQGIPVVGALVEIWQACHSGRYNHPEDTNTAELDPHFKYWGQAVTDARGFYRFRTIIPGRYPAEEGWVRPPHIHYKVSRAGYKELITQLYFAGDELNAKDQILSQLSEAEQEELTVIFRRRPGLPHAVGTFNLLIEPAEL